MRAISVTWAQLVKHDYFFAVEFVQYAAGDELQV